MAQGCVFSAFQCRTCIHQKVFRIHPSCDAGQEEIWVRSKAYHARNAKHVQEFFVCCDMLHMEMKRDDVLPRRVSVSWAPQFARQHVLHTDVVNCNDLLFLLVLNESLVLCIVLQQHLRRFHPHPDSNNENHVAGALASFLTFLVTFGAKELGAGSATPSTGLEESELLRKTCRKSSAEQCPLIICLTGSSQSAGSEVPAIPEPVQQRGQSNSPCRSPWTGKQPFSGASNRPRTYSGGTATRAALHRRRPLARCDAHSVPDSWAPAMPKAARNSRSDCWFGTNSQVTEFQSLLLILDIAFRISCCPLTQPWSNMTSTSCSLRAYCENIFAAVILA